MGQTTTHASRGLLQVQPDKTLGKKTALHLACHQDPVHNVARMGTGRTTAPLCLWKVGQSPTPTLDRVRPHRPLGPGSRRLMWPWDLGPLQDQLGGAQGSCPKSRWASVTYQTFQVSSFLHKSPPSKKKRQCYLELKFL
jgi:hypothetical protein